MRYYYIHTRMVKFERSAIPKVGMRGSHRDFHTLLVGI